MFELIGMVAAIGIVGWLVLLGLFVVSVAISEYERVEFVFFVAVALSIFLYFWNGTNVPLILWKNAGSGFTFTITWLVIGTVWSFWKWDRFCAKARATYDTRVGSSKLTWEDYIPRAMANKRKFVNWIILWPQSIFWYVFSDLISDLIDIILRQLGHVYDAIARRHFKDLAPTKTTPQK